MSGRIHFIGVGGAGMSAVAWLLAARGELVSGSDAADGPYLQALAARGLEVHIGHDAALVEGAAAVVISSAIKSTNPELAAAVAQGTPVWHRSEALARAVEGKRLIAVAGAHGKTTTSAMIAHALHASGIDATFAIGAPVFGVDGAVAGAYAGAGNIAVIEADESDGSFLNYRPSIAVITNVEPDHLDHYGTREAVEAAFSSFAALAHTLIVCADDAAAARVGEEAAAGGTTVVTYGAQGQPDVRVDAASLTHAGVTRALDLWQPGWHNRLNAGGAWTAAMLAGADPDAAAAAFSSFAGTARRYERKGEAGGVVVIDDYAHHPTEIRALLAAARREHPGATLHVLFQPHLYSRTRLLAQDFADALSVGGARVVVAGIYGARELPEPGVGPLTITSLMAAPARAELSPTAVENLRAAAVDVAAHARPGDVILTVGAGSVTDAGQWVLDELTRLSQRAGGGGSA